MNNIAVNIIFCVIGVLVGISQYICTKLIGKAVGGGKKEDVYIPVLVKLVAYGLLIAALLLFFEKQLAWCIGGVATGIIVACVVDYIRNKKYA